MWLHTRGVDDGGGAEEARHRDQPHEEQVRLQKVVEGRFSSSVVGAFSTDTAQMQHRCSTDQHRYSTDTAQIQHRA